MDAAPAGADHVVPLDLTRWPIILADLALADGRHLVLGDVDGPHHLWLRGDPDDGALAYVVLKDAMTELRLTAVGRLDRRLAGAPPARRLRGFHPSPFQRHRLSLLLDILDMLVPARGHVPSYAVARKFIYPAMSIRPGTEWKGSSERRQTQRLINEAFHLMHGGYRALLAGRPPGRQK